MMIVIMRGFRRMIFDEKCGQGHLVLIYINNKLKCSDFEKKGEMVNNDI